MALLEINALLASTAPRESVADADLRAARAGDPAAFARLIRAHQAAVHGVALRVCGNRADAEEVAQDAFLKLHACLGDLRDALHLRHWLLRTVSHRAIDRLRQRGRQVVSAGSGPLEWAAGSEPDEDHLLRGALEALLTRLTTDARAVMVLRYQEDLDPQEIAHALDMPLNTVKSHLRRSLEWLRAQVPELGP